MTERILIKLAELLQAGIHLGHRPAHLGEDTTLRFDPFYDAYYVRSPQDGEMKFVRLDDAWAAFQRATGLDESL